MATVPALAFFLWVNCAVIKLDILLSLWMRVLGFFFFLELHKRFSIYCHLPIYATQKFSVDELCLEHGYVNWIQSTGRSAQKLGCVDVAALFPGAAQPWEVCCVALCAAYTPS